MSDQKFVLYKQRDFSQKMNVTIDYIRENFLGLIKPILIVVIPMSLIYALVMSWLLGGMNDMMNGGLGDPSATTGFLMQAQVNNLISTVNMIVTYSFLIAIVCTYIKEKDAGREHEPMALVKLSSRYVLGVIGVMFLCGLVSLAGLIFLIIPGIYLMVATSIATFIYLFEDTSASDAFSKSFRLIKGKWWSTFGLMIVSGIIAILIGLLFSIPSYVMLLGNWFSSADSLQEDPSALMKDFDTWYGSMITALSMVGSYASYLIPIMALAFQYFNLSERKEGTGLKSQIEDFENLS